MKHDFVPGVTDQGRPRAAKGGFPYPGHGTLADQRDAASAIIGLQEYAAGLFRVTRDALVSRRRTDKLARARWALMLVYYEMGWSYSRIALAVNRADHTTAIHGVKRAVELCNTDASYRDTVNILRDTQEVRKAA